MSMDREQKRLAPEVVEKLRRFSNIYGEWLRARGQSHAVDDVSDDLSNALTDAESRAAQAIWATPALLGWQVLAKMDVLEHYHDRSEWSDQRDLRLLASIKADLTALLS